MKKFFALFMVCAMAATLSAGTKNVLLFNRGQFQAAKGTAATPAIALTVPLVYKGSFSVKGWYAWDNDQFVKESDIKGDANCVVDDVKASMPMYMTICQPCIDCYPCTLLPVDQTDSNDGTIYSNADTIPAFGTAAEAAAITRWNVYVIDVDKKAKKTGIYKLNMLDAATYAPMSAAFFTGALKDYAYVQYALNNGAFVLTGKKSDYKFSYVDAYLTDITKGEATWKETGAGKATAYIKSVTSFSGCYCLADMLAWDTTDKEYSGYQMCGTIKMSRNSSLTKKAINNAFSSTVVTTGNNWADCSVDTPADFCEAYFYSFSANKLDMVAGESNGVAKATLDAFDNYLLGVYKKYTPTVYFTYGLDTIIDSLVK